MTRWPAVLKDACKGLAIALAILAVLFLLFEVYLWNRYTREHARMAERFAGRDLCMRAAAHPRLVYELTPGRCGANGQGFADRERTFEKPPSVFRIVLIGDSVAAGQGVSRAERFGDRLEVALTAEARKEVEVVNLARGGYSTGQELLVLERWGLRYAPDLILWSYVLNDPAHPIFHDANGEAGRYFHTPRWRGYHYFSRKVFEAREQWRARRCPDEFHQLLHCAYRDQVQANLTRLAETARKAGIPVLFAITPVLFEGRSFAEYPYRNLHADLAAIASAAGLEVIDLLGALASADPTALAQDRTPWFDPWHPNARGHELFARSLAERLATRLGDRR